MEDNVLGLSLEPACNGDREGSASGADTITQFLYKAIHTLCVVGACGRKSQLTSNHFIVHVESASLSLRLLLGTSLMTLVFCYGGALKLYYSTVGVLYRSCHVD